MSKYKIIDGEEVEVEETKPFLAGALLETAKTPVTPYKTSHALIKTADEFVANKDNEKILEMGMGPRRVIPEESDAKENAGSFANEYTPLSPGFDDFISKGKEKYNEIVSSPEVPKPKARERYETRQFEYNLEEDPLWQQYISSARRNGQNAMTDTMAKVASQTGGIAGSYAVAAGAGAYNDYMQEANEVIPYLEQLAYQKYQDELTRDLNVYEMEEAERWENAERATALQKVKTDGAMNLTDDEKTIINASGDSWIVGDTVYTPEGELASDKVTENVILKGWQEKGVITDEDETYLRERGYWIDDSGNLIGPDGTNYTTKGGIIADYEAKYKTGATLTAEEIQALENSGQGYKYQNGVLYKNGVRIPKEYMGFDELQNAWNDFNSNTWYGMSEESKLILQENGFVFDWKTGNMKDANGNLYAPETGSATDNLLWKYTLGGQLMPEEMLFLNIQPGYTWDDSGKLLFNGEKVNVMTSTDKVKELDGGEIPGDLVAAWNEIVDKRGTNRALSANVYKTLGDYGFVRSNGQWIHSATGKSLESFFGETPSVYTNPGGGTQGGATSSTSTGGKTRYTKTPPQQVYVEESVEESAETPPPAPTSLPDLFKISDAETAKTTIEKLVDSGYMTEAEADALFLQYADKF